MKKKNSFDIWEIFDELKTCPSNLDMSPMSDLLAAQINSVMKPKFSRTNGVWTILTNCPWVNREGNPVERYSFLFFALAL